jgi:flagellar motor switch protein FliN/FliY
MADSLSQSEIDALLNTVGENAAGAQQERNASDVVGEFTESQEKIWQSVTIAASECVGKEVSFGNPLVVAAKPADLYPEADGDSLIVQFSFANMPQNIQVVVLPKETASSICEFVTGAGVDENVIGNVRPVLEGIVQGICLAAAAASNGSVIATDLVIRYQAAVLPESLRSATEAIRVQVAISGDGLSGTAIWLMDAATADFMLGKGPAITSAGGATFSQPGWARAETFDGETDEDPGLERILDIPFMLDVELGRVKMLVKDVCDLGTGSIVEIEKAAGELVDVLAGGRVVARGEVVVIDDYFGVRVTEILSPQDRLNRLNEICN